MKRLIVSVVLMATIVAKASVTQDGTVLNAYVASGTETYSTAIGSGITKLVKTGGGTLIVDVSNASFAGTVEIREGGIRTTAKNAIGKSNTIVVSPGAELVAAVTANLQRDSAFEGSTIKIAGSGISGNGALRYEGTYNAPALVRGKLVLTDSAAIGGNRQWGVGYDGEIDLAGHTLTNLASELFILYGTKFKDGPGDFVQTGYKVSLQNAPWSRNLTFNGSAANGFVVDGKTLQYYYGVDSSITLREAPPAVIPWTLKPRNSAAIEIQYGNEAQWNGPIVGDGTALTVSLASGKLLALKGSVTNVGQLVVNSSGTLRFVNADDVFFENKGTSLMKSGKVFAPLSASEPAKMEIYSNTTFRCSMPIAGMGTTSPSPGYTQFYVGNEQTDWTSQWGTHSNYWGTLRIADGAIVTNNIHVGSRGLGAVYQKNASVYIPTGDGSANYGCIGYANGSYGYWGATDSTLTFYGFAFLAFDVGSTGFLVQHGGNVTIENGEYYRISGGGDAVVYVDGGGRFAVSKLNLGYYQWNGASGGSVQFTVDGEGSVVSATEIDYRRRNNFKTYLNVNNGGALEAKYLYRGSAGDDSTSKAYLSFDGGIWRFPASSSEYNAYYGGASSQDAPHHATVFGGGATFDVVGAGTKVNITSPLEKATGKSIVAIALPSDADFAAAKHLGALRVEIDGAGEGASAFVAFDDEAGVPSRIVVTSPGFGYADGTTAKVVSMRGNKKWDCGMVTLAEISGGGIVKAGAGTLVLKAANTYAGTTTISNGTLVTYAAGAIPSGQPLVMAGGTLNLSSYGLSVSDISGFGSINGNNGTALTVNGKFSVNAADLVAGRALTATVPVVFGNDTVVEIADTESLDQSQPHTLLSCTAGITGTFVCADPEWAVRRSSDGKTLKLRYLRGLMLLIK